MSWKLKSWIFLDGYLLAYRKKDLKTNVLRFALSSSIAQGLVLFSFDHCKCLMSMEGRCSPGEER